MAVKFNICKKSGNITAFIHDAGEALVCSGEPMEELTANTVEASQEKHLPVVTVEGDKCVVKIGSVAHPMTEPHSILWVYLETEHGGQIKYLTPDDQPEATFALADDKPVAAYAYCNLHGLWKTSL